MLRFTPSEAVAENERLCGGSSDEIDGARGADVEGARWESIWDWVCWRRVGVERRVVEKGREVRRVDGVMGFWGVSWVILFV